MVRYLSFVIFLRSGMRPSRLWTNRFGNSILELNQVAVRKTFDIFHSGIEPLFSVTFPHKTSLFYFFWSKWTHGYLICSTPTFSSFIFVSFIVVVFSLRDSITIIGGHTQSLNNNIISQNHLNELLSFKQQNTHFLLEKSPFYNFDPLRPTPTHENLKGVEKCTFS